MPTICDECKKEIPPDHQPFPLGRRTVCENCFARFNPRPTTPAAEPTPPTPSAPSPTAAPGSEDPPTYGMVTVLGALAMVAGAVTIVMSLLLAFLTAMVPTAGAITPGGPVVIQSGVVLFSGVMGGIFQLGMGQLLFCIRDIAMNTYAMRRGI